MSQILNTQVQIAKKSDFASAKVGVNQVVENMSFESKFNGQKRKIITNVDGQTCYQDLNHISSIKTEIQFLL